MAWISRFGQDLQGPRGQKGEKERDEQGLNEEWISVWGRMWTQAFKEHRPFIGEYGELRWRRRLESGNEEP